MYRHDWSRDRLATLVAESYSYAQVLKKLNIVPAGGNYATLDKHIRSYGLNTEHFKGQGWNTDRTFPVNRVRLESKLRLGVPVNSTTLKCQLIKTGHFKAQCYKCRLVEWNGLPIPLELEHVNGDRFDNRLNNLTLLCPNCHAQTSTYRGKNIRVSGGTEYTESLKDSGLRAVRVQVPPDVRRYNTCYDCPRSISLQSTRCKACELKIRKSKVEWPSNEWLIGQLNSGRSYLSLAKELGVSDNAIRKRLKSRGTGSLG
jgi:hypothetical protein